ncbi:MAG: hypothetical protein KatS3mg035_0838 [Bacteroidia bacterium]|nr:MAG: hypothetical protein KatS3mg035_0838 [Bacteroidia bacterium]
MDASEKRYFKRYSSIHSDKKDSVSIQIFDVLDKMKSYSEEKLKEHFKDQKTAQHLHVSKNYLLKNILRSLRNFHQSFSKESELKDILVEIEILSQKKQYSLAYKILLKAYKTAYQYELFLQILEILQWISRIQFYEPRLALEELPNTEQELSKILEVFTWDAKLEAYLYQLIRYFENPASKIPLNIELPSQEHPVYEFISTQSLILFIKALTAQTQGDIISSFEYLKKAEKLFLKNKELIAEKPTRYFLLLAIQVDTAIQLKYFPEALQTILEAKAIYDSLKTHKIKAIKEDFDANFVYKLLHIYNSMGKYDQSIDFFEAFIAKNTDYQSVFPSHILLNIWIQIAYAYFAAGKYAQTIEYLELMRSRSFENSDYYQPFIFWLHLIANKKLKQQDKVSYRLNLFYQWLNQKSGYQKLAYFLNHLEPWFLNTQLKALEPFLDAQLHFLELQNFDVSTWIKSEYQNQSMLEYLKKS